ncbi:unnamed protein product [Boreogadus saida]
MRSRISIKMRGNPIGDNTSPSSARGLLFHTVPLLWIEGHGKDIKVLGTFWQNGDGDTFLDEGKPWI